MPTAYADIFRAVALRAKQLGEGSASDMETSYTAEIFRDEVDGIELPRSALKQDILAVEAELAAMVAASNNTIYKRALSTVSDVVMSKDEVPLVNNRGWRFLGAFDGIFDAEDGTPLTEQPKQVIRRRNANPGDFWKLPAYYFNIDGTIINHTRANGVLFRGCAWDYATQSNLYDTLFSNPIETTFMDTDVDNGSDGIIETQAHGYYTGLRVRVRNENETVGYETELPNGLSEGVDYYIILIDANHYRLAETLADSLAGTSINITTDPPLPLPAPQDQGPHRTIPQEVAGGGQSPLSQELAVLWQARVLAQLPQEDWFVQEAGFYAQLADSKANEVIEGRAKLMALPSMPIGSSRAAMGRD